MDHEKASAFLEAEEGRVASCYLDHLGYQTIGVGHLIDKRRGGRLSDTVIDMILREDIDEKWTQVTQRWRWAQALDDARQFVLLSMAFQLGISGLSTFTHTLALIEAGDYARAAEAMKASLWAKQTPARVARLAEQIETGEWVAKPGFPKNGAA